MLEVKKARTHFISHLKKNKRSPQTIANYDRHIDDLINFLNGLKRKHVHHITKKDLVEFIEYLEKKGYSKKSIISKAVTTRTFFKFLQLKEYITSNPAIALQMVKQKTVEPDMRVLSEVEYRALRDSVKDNPRFYGIIELLLQTGIKIGELTRITLKDLDFNKTSSRLKIRTTSNKVDREIPLNKKAEVAIKEYLRVRPQTKEQILFVTKTGKPFLIRNIRSAIKRYYKKAGVTDAKVHDLRHTFIAHHLKKGTSILVVAKMAGHKKLTTTEKYLSFIEDSPEDQIEKNAL